MAVCGAVLLVTGATAAAPATARTPCPGESQAVSGPDDVPAARVAVQCLVEAERTGRGLNAPVPSERLDLAAQRHSDDMVARDYFGHTALAPAPHGPEAADRVRNAGYDVQLVRENLVGGLATPLAVVRAWIVSVHHCEQLLDPDIADVGVGITAGAFAGTEGPAWTLLVATERGAVVPDQDVRPAAGCPYADVGVGQLPPPPDPAPAPPVLVAGPAAPALPQAALRNVRVRWAEGLLRVSGSVRPAVAGRRVVVRVLRDGRRERVALRTRAGGRFVTLLPVDPDGRAGTVKLTVSGVPGELRTVTVTRRLPRA